MHPRKELGAIKPPKFDYYRPQSLAEALEILAELGDSAKVMAGGQSLLPLLNFRLARPQALVDLGGLEELRYVHADDGHLRVGALTCHRSVERSAAVERACPLLKEAVGLIGHEAIRSRGTVGGSIAHADPAAELPTVLTALDGRLIIRGLNHQREVGPEEFFLTYCTTMIEPGEILTEVRLPAIRPGEARGQAFVEMSRRHGDFALAGVAASVRLDDQGRCTDAGLALCGVGPYPIRVRAAEQVLHGENPLGSALDEVCGLATAAAEPESDLHASADYRRLLVGVLTGQAVRLAVARAKGEQDHAGCM